MVRFAAKNRSVLKNDKGVSLVEVMIALLVLLLVFIGLLQGALLGIDSNFRNILRDEGVAIATSTMEQVRNRAFVNLFADAASLPSDADCPASFTVGTRIQRNFRNVANKDFCSSVTCIERGAGSDNDCTTDDADTKQITVAVGWRWKGEDYTHTISTLRRR